MQIHGFYVRRWPAAISPLAPAVISLHLPARAGWGLLSAGCETSGASQVLPGGGWGGGPHRGESAPTGCPSTTHPWHRTQGPRYSPGPQAQRLWSTPASITARASQLRGRSTSKAKTSRFSSKWQGRMFAVC